MTRTQLQVGGFIVLTGLVLWLDTSGNVIGFILSLVYPTMFILGNRKRRYLDAGCGKTEVR